VLPFDGAGLDDGDDAGMVELSDGLSFGLEARYIGLAGKMDVANHLNRDFAIQVSLGGEVDDAHTAPPEGFFQDVGAEWAGEGFAGGDLFSGSRELRDDRDRSVEIFGNGAVDFKEVSNFVE